MSVPDVAKCPTCGSGNTTGETYSTFAQCEDCGRSWPSTTPPVQPDEPCKVCGRCQTGEPPYCYCPVPTGYETCTRCGVMLTPANESPSGERVCESCGLPTGKADGAKLVDLTAMWRDGKAVTPTHAIQSQGPFIEHWRGIIDRPLLSYIEDRHAELAALREEIDDYDKLTQRQSKLLAGVVNAIRGKPEPMQLHSHHDAAELTCKLVLERDLLRAAITKPESFVGVIGGEIAAEMERLKSRLAAAEGEAQRVIANMDAMLGDMERLTIERDAARAEADRLARKDRVRANNLARYMVALRQLVNLRPDCVWSTPANCNAQCVVCAAKLVLAAAPPPTVGNGNPFCRDPKNCTGVCQRDIACNE